MLISVSLFEKYRITLYTKYSVVPIESSCFTDMLLHTLNQASGGSTRYSWAFQSSIIRPWLVSEFTTVLILSVFYWTLSVNARAWAVTQLVHLLFFIIFALFFLFNFNFFSFFMMNRLFVIERNLDHNSVNFDKLAPRWAVGSPQICLPSASWRFLIFPDTFCFLLWNFLIGLWRILVICIPILTTSSIWLLFLLILIYLLILRLRLLLCFRIRCIVNCTWLFWRYSFSNSFLLSRVNIF